jgi:hypothetical protein
MTPADSLYVNNWVAISGDKHEQSLLKNSRVTLLERAEFSGEPLKIIAISYPFVLVKVQRRGFHDVLDLRRFEVVKLHKTFVAKVLEQPVIEDEMMSKYVADEEYAQDQKV